MFAKVHLKASSLIFCFSTKLYSFSYSVSSDCWESIYKAPTLMLDRGRIQYGYGDTIIFENLGYDTAGIPQSID